MLLDFYTALPPRRVPYQGTHQRNLPVPQRRSFEKRDAANLHTLEVGSLFLILELCLVGVKRTDVCQDEDHRPLKDGVCEIRVKANFHTLEVGSLFLIPELCMTGGKVTDDVCRDEAHRPFKDAV